MTIIGAINASKDHQYAHSRGRTSPFLSRSLFKQEVHRGGTKCRLAEIRQLSSDKFHLLFLDFNLTMTLRVKHWLKHCSKPTPLSLFRFPHPHQVQVL
jgi:hypothetical protein